MATEFADEDDGDGEFGGFEVLIVIILSHVVCFVS